MTTVLERLVSDRPVFSVEFFPPRSDEEEDILWRAIRRLEPLDPACVLASSVDLLFVEPARSFLAVTGQKRDGGAFINKTGYGLNLFGCQAEGGCNVSENL
jgi:hypothetical protein